MNTERLTVLAPRLRAQLEAHCTDALCAALDPLSLPQATKRRVIELAHMADGEQIRHITERAHFLRAADAPALAAAAAQPSLPALPALLSLLELRARDATWGAWTDAAAAAPRGTPEEGTMHAVAAAAAGVRGQRGIEAAEAALAADLAAGLRGSVQSKRCARRLHAGACTNVRLSRRLHAVGWPPTQVKRPGDYLCA